MSGEAKETYVASRSALTAVKSTRIAGDDAEDVLRRHDAFRRLRERVPPHGADELRPSLGRVVDQAVLRAVLVEQGDEARVGIRRGHGVWPGTYHADRNARFTAAIRFSSRR